MLTVNTLNIGELNVGTCEQALTLNHLILTGTNLILNKVFNSDFC